MTKLTKAQIEILQAAASGSSNDVDRRTASALIKRGFAISLPKSEGGSQLMITDAGRAAIAAPDSSADDSVGGVEPKADPALDSPEAPVTEPRPAPKGKLGALVALLRRAEGARVDEMMQATGLQAHSVRGAMSGSLKKAMGLTIDSEKTADGRVYRIIEGPAA